MTAPTLTSTARFAELFDRPLPRDLREDAEAMCHDAFIDRYGHQHGPVRLGNWEAVGRQVSGVGDYRATIAVGDRIATTTAAATGSIAALTEMLAERGVAIEALRFHQLPTIGGATATFIRGTDGVHDTWAMGWARDPVQSALRAMIACVNRLAA
ncbi:MAG: homocitrate synthase [Mycobacterium sp.]